VLIRLAMSLIERDSFLAWGPAREGATAFGESNGLKLNLMDAVSGDCRPNSLPYQPMRRFTAFEAGG
jgi:hypothetical protein